LVISQQDFLPHREPVVLRLRSLRPELTLNPASYSDPKPARRDEFLDHMAHAGRGRAVLTASGPDEAAQEDPVFGAWCVYVPPPGGLRGAADSIPDREIGRTATSRPRRSTAILRARSPSDPWAADTDARGPGVGGRIVMTERTSAWER